MNYKKQVESSHNIAYCFRRKVALDAILKSLKDKSGPDRRKEI